VGFLSRNPMLDLYVLGALSPFPVVRRPGLCRHFSLPAFFMAQAYFFRVFGPFLGPASFLFVLSCECRFHYLPFSPRMYWASPLWFFFNTETSAQFKVVVRLTSPLFSWLCWSLCSPRRRVPYWGFVPDFFSIIFFFLQPPLFPLFYVSFTPFRPSLVPFGAISHAAISTTITLSR